MKVLVLGSAGMLGSSLVKELGLSHEVISRSRENYDLRDDKAFAEDISETRPQWVANCAAYTKVDLAEDEHELAIEINGHAPGRLAGRCSEAGVNFLQISTDYVFKGDKASPYKEDDPTGPLSAYGKSKLAGERAIMEACPEGALIVRSSGLFGQGGPSFVRALATRYSLGQREFSVVDDQTTRPTYTPDLASGLRLLLEKGVSGIYHACNSGYTTWYGLALEIFGKIGEGEVELKAVSTAEYGAKAERPSFSVLDTKKFESETGAALPAWKDALRRYLDLDFKELVRE